MQLDGRPVLDPGGAPLAGSGGDQQLSRHDGR
jgi:hypothetical protein